MSTHRTLHGWRARAPLALAIALTAALAADSTSACTEAPVLHAVVDGSAARLSWTGTLEAGESWAVYRGDLGTLHATGTDTSAIRASGPATELVEPDPGTWYWRVRCEGGAAPGSWSNMAFRLDTSLTAVPAGSFPWRFLSLPSAAGLPDVGAGADHWPCDEPGDGVFSSRDLACHIWTAREGAMTSRLSVEWVDGVGCAYTAAYGDLQPGQPPTVLGTLANFGTPPLLGSGLVLSLTGDVVPNDFSVIGAHDPTYPGYVVTTHGDTCFVHVVSVPYHCVYRSVDELLCGVEGIDWVEDMFGRPDRCENGLFDSQSGATVSVVGANPEAGYFESRTVTHDALFNRTIYAGRRFDLLPGDAYLVFLTAGYQDRLFRPPTY